MPQSVAQVLEYGEVQLQLITSAVLMGVLAVVWLVATKTIQRHVDDSALRYRARKWTTYVIASIALVSLLVLWVEAIRGLGTFLGLAAVGIAIALSDPLRNIAGWLYLVLRRPYKVDDRIEVNGIAGDVIDIRVFRTTLLEIGNWVDADQSTGRIVHIPNGMVLAAEVFNATEGFGYLWHEIQLRLTFESDWRRGEQLLLAALEAASDTDQAAARIREASRSYKIRYTHLSPTVYVTVKEHGIVLTGRVLVEVRRRRAIDQQVWRTLLDSMSTEPTVSFAYPTSRTVLNEPIHLAGAARGEQPIDALERRGV